MLKSNSSSNNNNSMVSQANMSRLLKQMSLIVSTELQQIAIDLYERMDESGGGGGGGSGSSGDKPVKYIKLKEEFRQQHHSSSSSPSMLPSPIPISHSSPQFKSLMSSSNQSAVSTSSSQSNQTSTSQPSSSSSAPTLAQATKQQLNALIQMNSLTASFNKVDLTSSGSNMVKSAAAVVAGKSQQQQQPLPQIFNPKKDLEQFYAKEKKSNTSAEMSAFRSTASSSFFYSDTF